MGKLCFLKRSIAKCAIFTLVVQGLFITTVSAANSSSWSLLSPRNNSDVKTGELFIAIDLKDEVNIQNGTIQIYIDEYMITSGVKISDKKITLLYLQPLKKGAHDIKIKAKAKNIGWMSTLKATFHIGRTGPDRLAPIDTVTAITEHKVQLSGTIIGDYTGYDVTGPGSAARQAVPFVYNMNADVVLKVGNVRFPVIYRNTSDQFNYPLSIQPRNYFQAGIETNSIGVYYGDMNPMFDRLALTGTRINGYRFSLNRPKFKVDILHGDLQRAFEGQLLSYDPKSGNIPPPTLQGDSSYIVPGYYKRKISAARLSFGNKQEGSTLGLNFLKVKDDTTSIKYGTKPIDNLVTSIDETFVTPGSKLKISTGAAISLLTNDVSQGVAEKKVIDSITGTDYHIDPQSFQPFLIMNASTVKPGKASSTAYLTTVLRGKNQMVTIDGRYVGSGYRSYGNPFIRSDIKSASLQDQLNFLKRKVLLTARYLIQQNNLNKTLPVTLTTQSINGNLIIAPSAKLPQIGLMYYTQIRNTPETGSKYSTVNDESNTLSASLNYSFTAARSQHGINLQYTKTNRIDRIRERNNNSTYVYSAGIMEIIKPINTTLDLRYVKLLFQNDEFGLSPLSDVYEARLKYEWKKIKTTFSTTYYINMMSKTAFSSASERRNMSGAISCRALKNLTLEIEGGYAPYMEMANTSYNYNEQYYTARMIYNFDWK